MAMNIKQAKQEITNTLRAYLEKDELGNYLIPSNRQRPVLLMGPPGIGKTQIMEQIAQETGVGLVAYTITHHTRQSAIGLPYIDHKEYNGEEVVITEYTMSEILASVYNLMETTGIREGILFLDEINCVSETLAPVMLQFLQNKTFGNRRMPEGWLICAAGNPPEFNRSARDFDVVTLDRVKRIEVEQDYGAWKEYARRKGLHGAVVNYLDIKKDHFYQIGNTAQGLRFATARGWEDLSEIIFAYEKLGLQVTREVVEQYIQMPFIAKDFANYLALYYKYQRTYNVESILSGEWEKITVLELRAAPFDEKLSVMGLLFSRLTEGARNTRRGDELTEELHKDLLAFREEMDQAAARPDGLVAGGDPVGPAAVLERMAQGRRNVLKTDVAAGRLDKEKRDLYQRDINLLEEYAAVLRSEVVAEPGAAMDLVRARFGELADQTEAAGEETGRLFDNAFRFLEETFGQGQELVLFVTEITAGYDSSWFVQNYGCDAYFRHNQELLFDDTNRIIREEIAAMQRAEREEARAAYAAAPDGKTVPQA